MFLKPTQSWSTSFVIIFHIFSQFMFMPFRVIAFLIHCPQKDEKERISS